MLRKVLIVLIIVIIVVGAAVYIITRGPDLSAYERFREPAMLTMPDQKVLVVEAVGNPDNTAGEAIKLLFGLYYKIDGVPKGRGVPAPRARWPESLDTPKDQWVGRYAMPVPDSATRLPQFEAKPGFSAQIDRWTYGEVAQILHVGPYENEGPTIERLNTFIKEKGYEVAGEHEEEYLRGPTMFGKGNPDKNYTLVRYVVRPSAR